MSHSTDPNGSANGVTGVTETMRNAKGLGRVIDVETGGCDTHQYLPYLAGDDEWIWIGYCTKQDTPHIVTESHVRNAVRQYVPNVSLVAEEESAFAGGSDA